MGEHTVLFAGRDELVEIKHTALSKEIFAIGAVNAAKFLLGKAPGLYDMTQLIG
ncbi:MAG: dihydrodipicolinate reductase C-terminal domain-containing protein [Clostridia bacterium]